MRFDVREIGSIVKEVQLQQDECPEEFVGFALAYADAKSCCLPGECDSPKELMETILRWAELINNHLSCSHAIYNHLCISWRRVPVTIQGRVIGADAIDIPGRMYHYCSLFSDRVFNSATDAYSEFEEIHPFEDGNGRIGMLIYNLYHHRLNGEWNGGELGRLPPRSLQR